MKFKHISYLSILVITLLCACTTESESTDIHGDTFTVTYYFRATGTTTQTRALNTNDENHIEDLFMLIFDKNDKFLYYNKAVAISNTATDGHLKRAAFQFQLTDDVADIRIAFIANLPNADMTIGAITKNTKLEDVQNLLTFDSSTTWNTESSDNFTPIPMWNLQDDLTTLTQGAQTTTVVMTRALGRINVTLNNGLGLTGIEIASVDVYNYRKAGYIWPSEANFDNNSYVVNDPTVDNIVTPLSDGVNESLTYNLTTTANSLLRTIYLAETDANVILVLGLKIYDVVEYFKIEVIDEYFNTTPILRNYSYNCNIVAYSELRGHLTKEEAYNSKSENLIYTLNVIDNSSHNIMITDEQYVLCMDYDRFTVGLDGGELDWLVYTDAPNGWRLDPSSFFINGVASSKPDDFYVSTYHANDNVDEGVSELNYYLTIKVGAQAAPRTIDFYIQTVPSRVFKKITIEQK